MQYHFDLVEEIIGFSTENASIENGATSKINILMSGVFTSDDLDFYNYVDKFCSMFLYPKGVFIDSVSQFLMVIHADQSGDLFVNDFPVTADIVPKKDMKKGEVLMLSDIADIRRVKFPGIPITATDKIIYCFKVGWRFGLFFDLSPNVISPEFENSNEVQKFDIENAEATIGALRRYLTFYQIYKLIESKPQFQILMNDGWFPFIEILSGEYEVLGGIYQSKFEPENRINNVLDKFTVERIKRITDRWWLKDVFKEKRTIIEAGVNAYLQNTTEGFINSIKNLITEIEGVLRKIYHIETGNGKASAKDLIFHIIEKAKLKSDSEMSLFLPEPFLEYLQNVVFAKFDGKDEVIDLSRNSSSHGMASSEQYTKSRALQAILVLDQIFYYT